MNLFKPIHNLIIVIMLKASIQRKINQMIDVVSMAHDTGLQWLDGLLTSVSFNSIIFCHQTEIETDKSIK